MQVELQQISKRYGYQWILRDLDMTLLSGSVTGIKGLNGSGKSTLVKIISGFLSPSDGKVKYTIADKEIKVADIYKQVSWVAPYLALTDNYTISEIYKLQSKFKPMVTESVDQFIDLIQLRGHEDKYIKDFSSGMQQRLKLGLSILSRTPLLLLDEPTSYLDTNAIQWYHDLLSQHLQSRTVIIASNDEADLAECGSFHTVGQ